MKCSTLFVYLAAAMLASSSADAQSTTSPTRPALDFGAATEPHSNPGIEPNADPNAEFEFPVFDRANDGALWVHGTNFKARFDRRGLEFIPFLGSDAPQDYPVDLALESARVGSTELAWQNDVEPELDGQIVTFHRGVLDEIYTVGADSIEQTFMLRDRPSAGDLHVVVHTTSELERADSDLGTCFANELGGVHVGKASVRDARGRTLHSGTHLNGESIEIAVPSSELAAAAFPLAIDPVLSVFQVSDNVVSQSLNPDTAYDVTYDRWIVVYEVVFSGTDHDVIAREYRGNGTSVNQSTYIDMTSDNWTNPRVADSRPSHQFLVVGLFYNAGWLPLGLLIGRIRDAASATMLAPQFLEDPAPGYYQNTYPDVGGDSSATGHGNFLVACREYHPSASNLSAVASVLVVLVSPTGQRLNLEAYHSLSTDDFLSLPIPDNVNAPRITKNGVASWEGNFYTAWGLDYLSDAQTLNCELLLEVQNPLGILDIWEGQALTQMKPPGGCQSGPPAIAMTPPFGGGGPVVLSACVDGAGRAWGMLEKFVDPNFPALGYSHELDPVSGSAQGDIGLTYDGTRFVLTYDQKGTPPDLNSHIYMASESINFTTLDFARVDSRSPLANPAAFENLPALGSLFAGGSPIRNCLCVYQLGKPSTTTASPAIDASLFAAN